MDLITPSSGSDPLGDALHFLRMSGAFYCRSELTDPWGLTLPALADYLWFHVVTTGSMRLELPDGEPERLERGDMAVVTHGTGHVLRGTPGAPVPGILELEREEVSDRYEILRHGGDGPLTRLICGAVRFDHPAARNLVASLPDVIRIEGDGGEGDWMQGTLSLMAAETRDLRPGGEAVITRLSDVLVIQAIRSWIERDPTAQTGWLGALRDPQIGRALALIHGDPARAWTVASLADELAMSRSSFAARFSELVGEPVIQYVTRWRMQVATSSLEEEGATVAELASRLGYRSEAAFARAYKRTVGVAPGAVKRRRSSAEELAAEVA
ncbi:MAG TPA: AraC family transcriptional regulator [Solirubrobacterales bacterium]